MRIDFINGVSGSLLTGLLLLATIGQPASAERFLTIDDAQKTLFPTATSFRSQTIRFTEAETKAIANHIGARVRHRGHRFWIATADEDWQGILVLDQVLGKHELIEYAVAVSPQGKVLGLEILEYRESHGGEIRQKLWREQFQGKTPQSKLQLNEDIYNISGATISCRNVTEGVRRVLATFDLVLRPRLSDRGHFLPKSAD